ncbi:hypothetical protein BD770DRAFT_412019 [Pilaira anomala]|nr:hypothetical protein BD770DRAFT_412019 [Pilaira anomala]
MDSESIFAPEFLQIIQRKAALRQKEDEELCQFLREKGYTVDYLLDVQHKLLKPYLKDPFEITRKVNPYNVFCELKKRNTIAPPAIEEKLTAEILFCLYKNLTEAEREALEEAAKMKQHESLMIMLQFCATVTDLSSMVSLERLAADRVAFILQLELTLFVVLMAIPLREAYREDCSSKLNRKSFFYLLCQMILSWINDRRT